MQELDPACPPERRLSAAEDLVALALGATPCWTLASVRREGEGRAHLTVVHGNGASVDAPEPVEMVVDLEGDRFACPECLAPEQPVVRRRLTHWRYFAPLGRSVHLECALPVVCCDACGERAVALPWAGQPGFVQLDGVRLGDAEVSPRQYRYAFADLRDALPEQDSPILWHYDAYGDAEIKSGRRPMNDSVLGTIALQNFSPRFWGDVPSPYFKLVLGETDTLDIIFSYTFIPEGQFQLDTVPSRNTRLFLNTRDNNFYQRGIPGVTGTIEETAAWLGRIVAYFSPRTIRTHGSSMGGYAALLFGHLLGADGIYTTGPQVRLGDPYCRSWEWNRLRRYHPRWRDLTPLLPSVIDRSHILFLVGEIFEYGHVAAFEQAGLDKLYFVQGGHPGMKQMAWDKIFATQNAIGFDDGVANAPRYPFRYGPEAIAKINRAYVAIRLRDHGQAASLLREIIAFDPENHGLRYRLGVHEVLLGQEVSGFDHLVRALAAIWRVEAGADRSGKQAQWLRMLDLDYNHILPRAELEELIGLFPLIWEEIEPHAHSQVS